MLKAELDKSTGIVRTFSQGYSTPEEQTAYIATMARLKVEARRINGCSLHLVDARASVIQSSFAAERLSTRHKRDDNCAGDRTAVVTRSHLASIPAPAGNDFGQIRFFDNLAEAEAWLRQGRPLAKAS